MKHETEKDTNVKNEKMDDILLSGDTTGFIDLSGATTDDISLKGATTGAIDTSKLESLKWKLWDVYTAINWADFSQQYFEKNLSWVYQRMDHMKVNGKPVRFTKEEKKQFKNALLDLSNRIKKSANEI